MVHKTTDSIEYVAECLKNILLAQKFQTDVPPPVNIALPVVIEEPDDPQATADQRFLTVGYQDTGQHRFSPDSISFGFVIRTTDQPQNRKNTLI